MYTEQELQQAVREAKDYQRSVDDAAAAAESAIKASSTINVTPTPKTYYVFAAINASFSRPTIQPYTDYYTYTSDIIEYSYKPTKDEEYRLLDKLNSGNKISTDQKLHSDFKTEKRKVFVLESYAAASEKRQEVLSDGIK